MITDTAYVLDQLRAGPKDAMQIISASIRDRSVGCTVHSRVADLRAQGYVISCGIEGKTRKGRDRYVYRLISEPENAGITARHRPVSVERDPQQGSVVGFPTADPLDAPIPGQLEMAL